MLKRIFKLSQYSDLLQAQQATLTVQIQLIVLGIYTIYLTVFPSILYAPRTLLQYFIETESTLDFILLAIFYIVAILSLFSVRRGKSQTAAWLTLGAWVVMSIGNTYDSGLVNPFTTVVVLTTTMIGGLLIGRDGLLVSFGITIVGLALGIFLRPYLTP